MIVQRAVTFLPDGLIRDQCGRSHVTPLLPYVIRPPAGTTSRVSDSARPARRAGRAAKSSSGAGLHLITRQRYRCSNTAQSARAGSHGGAGRPTPDSEQFRFNPRTCHGVGGRLSMWRTDCEGGKPSCQVCDGAISSSCLAAAGRPLGRSRRARSSGRTVRYTELTPDRFKNFWR
jgi:hypothetical protein